MNRGKTFTRETKLNATNAVNRRINYSVFDLEWDAAFDAVKRNVAINDYQRIADLTKEVLSELASEEKTREYKKKHKRYINSDRWKRRRRNYMLKKNYKCEDCGDTASQVHHTSYDNFNAIDASLEFQDLAALCDECHSKRHRKRGDLP